MKKILVIDDDLAITELMNMLLKTHGFDVITTNSGAEGVKLAEIKNPNVVLLDLMMPDMDGWEVYQQIKADEKTKNIPVIVVTAKAQSIDKVLGLHIAKVDDYIAKPFSPQDLLNSVEKILQKT